MGERLQRLWPSLVALVGTIAVVLSLLYFFGSEIDDSTPDDIVAEDDEADDEGGAGGDTDGSQSSDGDDSGDPTDEGSADPEESEPDDEPTTAPSEVREPVGIANQTDVEGLEEQARETLEEGGWEVPAVSPFEGTVPETTVYYPEGQEEAAEALSAQFPEIGRVQPTFEGVNTSRLVVVLADDYRDEVGESE